MTLIKINIPGYGEHEGDAPIVILGPNGSGKTRLAQKLAEDNQVSAISAQRRTWVDDSLPVLQEEQLRSNVKSQEDRWRQHSWQPTEEINFVLSTLIQEHSDLLTKRNEQAIESGKPFEPVNDTKLIQLQVLWNRLFKKRKLEIGGFFPKVKRLDFGDAEPSYQLRQMSDGERTVLYMAARVLTVHHPVILVDEPELHMHSRLAVQFWDEAEKLRPDCRFVYISHDLNFTLSRRRATILVIRQNDDAKAVAIDQVSSSVAAEVLGAATLPFYAKRIFLFEGEPGRGFASEFFSAWFDCDETFVIPCGGCDSVCAAVSGLKTVGVVAAQVIGLIDRDYRSEAVLAGVSTDVTVLALHEIESVLCDREIVSSVAEHLGKNPTVVWDDFLDCVRREFRDQALSNVIARRVRTRIGDLLDGAFNRAQVVADLQQTGSNHASSLSQLDLPNKTSDMFAEETKRVANSLEGGGAEMLKILPGKHLLSIMAGTFGYSDTSEYTGLVLRSLDRKRLKKEESILTLGTKMETALLRYLPSRKV